MSASDDEVLAHVADRRAPARTGWPGARRVWVLLRAQAAIAARRDLFPRLLFGAAFAIYFWIGRDIARRDAFRLWNIFFNAD